MTRRGAARAAVAWEARRRRLAVLRARRQLKDQQRQRLLAVEEALLSEPVSGPHENFHK